MTPRRRPPPVSENGAEENSGLPAEAGQDEQGGATGRVLAREMVRSWRREVEALRRSYRERVLEEKRCGPVPGAPPPPEADPETPTGKALELVDAPKEPETVRRAREASPDDLDWWGVRTLAEASPEALREKWAEVVRAARDELESGLSACLPLDGSPMDRARFLVIREALIRDFQPREGIESLLVDQLALCHLEFLSWTAATHRDYLEPERWESDVRRPPLASDHATRGQALDAAERFQRMASRIVRTLRDLRRFGGKIHVHGGQVNVAERQIVAGGPTP